MLSPTVLENETHQLEVLSDNYLSPVPRDERFDRIARTAMRLLEIPIAFVSVNEEDSPWLRSVQGLPADQTSHALAFCDPQLLQEVLMVSDASTNPLFWKNPLVAGQAHVRSYLGVPLYQAPGQPGGALCAMHTEPRAFRQQHVLALQDLARLAEAELRLDALTTIHKRVMVRLGQLERRAQFDGVTGCWNVRRFRELLATHVADARERASTLALCYVRVCNFEALAQANGKSGTDTIRQFIAQMLRQRLPDQGALCSLGGADFCALVPGPTALAVEDHLSAFSFPKMTLDGPGIRLDLELQLTFGLALLHEMSPMATATDIWATALAALDC
jgi:GGDEF domain-containing protein